jgi:hypothetical protein
MSNVYVYNVHKIVEKQFSIVSRAKSRRELVINIIYSQRKLFTEIDNKIVSYKAR